LPIYLIRKNMASGARRHEKTYERWQGCPSSENAVTAGRGRKMLDVRVCVSAQRTLSGGQAFSSVAGVSKGSSDLLLNAISSAISQASPVGCSVPSSSVSMLTLVWLPDASQPQFSWEINLLHLSLAFSLFLFIFTMSLRYCICPGLCLYAMKL
jgi:hypothetical protein